MSRAPAPSVRRRAAGAAGALATASALAVALVSAATGDSPARPTRSLPHEVLTARGEIVEAGGPIVEAMPPDILLAAPTTVPPANQAPPPAPEGAGVDFRSYPDPAEAVAFLRDLERDHPDLVEVFEVGHSSLGRPLVAVRLANRLAPGEIADRPVMYLDGQHHAREMITHAVALYTIWRLVDAHGRDPYVTHLLDTRVLLALPSVNPDGNEIALSDCQFARKTASRTACDDDDDGRFDEDPTTGYGYGTHTLSLYHFDRSWADAHPVDPFVGDWRNQLRGSEPIEELGRYTGAFGGPVRRVPSVDDDRDRQTDEDELGGTDPNRNYGYDWAYGDQRCRSDSYRGPAPWSEPETAAVRDLLAAHPRASTGLSLHSGVDVILHPWGMSTDADLPDAWLYELLGRKGSQLTEVNGFPGSPHGWSARSLYQASGSTMDHLYADRGIYAFTPEVYGGDGLTLVSRLGGTGTFTVGQCTGAVFNPPPDGILASVDRWYRFALYMLAATPNVELLDVEARDGQLLLRLANDGALPAVLRGVLSADGRPIAAWGPTRLSAEAVSWAASLPELPDGPLELLVHVEQPIGTLPHEIELGKWTLRKDGPAVLVPGGLPEPVDLAAMFPDGWWADERWDIPGTYHLPPDAPISVTPPTPTPTPPPTATETVTATASALPTATLTSTEPPSATATPSTTTSPPDDTPTASSEPPSPPPAYLPHLAPGAR